MNRTSVGDRREKFYFIFWKNISWNSRKLGSKTWGICEAMHLVKEIRVDLRYTYLSGTGTRIGAVLLA